MSYGGPRELPKTDRARQNIINDRMAPGSNRGATRWARRDPRGQQQRYQPPSVSPILAYAQFDDPGSSTATSYMLDPSVLGDSEGDYSSYMEYGLNPNDSTPGVVMLSLGWYQVYVYIEVGGLTPGDRVGAEVDWSTASAFGPTPAAVANSAGGAVLTACSLPQKNYDTTGVIQVTVDNPAGGTISDAHILVMKWAD